MIIGSGKSEPDIKDFKEDHTDTTVSFTVTATKEKIDIFEKGKDGLYGKFKLLGKLHTSNMNLFDEVGRIIKYQNPHDILTSFYNTRMDFYHQRKELLLSIMQRDLKILGNKARFVEEVCKNELIINNRKRKDILYELQERGYDLFDNKKEKEESESDDVPEENATDGELARGYEYLLGMKIWNLTFEQVQKLRQQVEDKQKDVVDLEATPLSQLWENDLEAIEDLLDERDEEIDVAAQEERKAQKKSSAQRQKKAQKNKKIAKKAKKKKDEWDSELEDDDDSLDGRNAVFHSDDEEIPIKKEVTKKTTIRKRGTTNAKRAKNETSKISDSVSKVSDMEILSENISQRLTISPERKKPSLTESIDSFLLSTTTSSKVNTKKSPPAKRANATSKSNVKKTKKKAEIIIESSEEDEPIFNDSEEEFEVAKSATSSSRPKRTMRARQTKTSYAVDLEDSDALIESSEESDVE